MLDVMIDTDVLDLFHQLNSRYPKAAAGLVDQLCSDLACLLHDDSDDCEAIAGLCDPVRR